MNNESTPAWPGNITWNATYIVFQTRKDVEWLVQLLIDHAVPFIVQKNPSVDDLWAVGYPSDRHAVVNNWFPK